MKCPHCQVEIHAGFQQTQLNNAQPVGEEDGYPTWWTSFHMKCPACMQALIFLHKSTQGETTEALVYPRNSSRPPAPKIVPAHLAEDFNEALQVLAYSPKASAALSRRCLQSILREQGYDQKDLAPAIQAALDARQLPGSLADNLDSIRNIGNFAAHPMKDKESGSIVAVEPEEAEWNLEVLEGLFEFYYVQPAKNAARTAALNAKLKAAGKPAVKSPAPQRRIGN